MQDARTHSLRKKLFNMISIGVVDNRLNQSYDIISTLALVVNLIGSFASTFDSVKTAHPALLYWIEAVTVLFFAIDYVLRVVTAPEMFPDRSTAGAVRGYVLSGYGIIDLLSFLPHYLPVFFPAGAAVFRMLRVVRIFRLFRINAYYDSLNVIGNVLKAKKTQIFASIFIIILLILASSLCMYSVEHEAQPEVFRNAFSAIWWATSTLLTVGYGDIYPITVAGQLLGIVITFLGVGLVAIPTGIISAGFVEEYQKVKRLSDIESENAIHFIEVRMRDNDHWVGRKIKELGMPRGTIIAAIVRGKKTLIPRGDVEIEPDDRLIICAESARGQIIEDMKEIVLRKNHPWNGVRIRDLDISRQSFIVLIDRKGRMIIPDGGVSLREGDKVLMYTRERISKYEKEPLF